MQLHLSYAAATVLALAGCAGEDSEAYADETSGAETYEIELPQSSGASAAQPQQYAQAAPQQQQQVQQAPTSGGLQTVQIVDPSGFEKPMVAATIKVPVGWKTQGGINWQPNMAGCGPQTPHINWNAVAPDGVGMISLLPQESWSGLRTGMQMPPIQSQCPNVTVTDTRQFIEGYVQRYRPNARVLDYRDRSDSIVQLQQQLAAQPNMDMYGSKTKMWAGAGQALVAYQVNGKEVRELIGTSVMFNTMYMPGAMQNDWTETVSIAANPGYAMRMPNGELDMDQAEALRLSIVANPQYTARMAKHSAKISSINAKGAADRAKIRSNTNNDILDMQMDSWRKQQASSDRSQREFNEYIGDYETYNDPQTGGTVQLDSGYDRNFQLQDGSYVQTNDQFYDPYADTGQDATELEPTP